MKDHMNPTMHEKWGHVILYVGTKCLNGDKEPELISKPIAYLACTLKSNFVDVSISDIIVFDNKYNKKGIVVDSHLKNLCIEKNIFVMDYKKTFKSWNLSNVSRVTSKQNRKWYNLE